MTEDARGAGLEGNTGSGTFGAIFGGGQEAVQGGRLSVGKIPDSREPRPRQARNSLP